MTSGSGGGWSARRTLGIGLLLVLGFVAVRLVANWRFDAAPPVALAEAGRLGVNLADGRPARLGDAIRPGVPTVVWMTWSQPMPAASASGFSITGAVSTNTLRSHPASRASHRPSALSCRLTTSW